MLKPEQFKTVKPLTDGEAIDLDSAVEALVDRRAGHTLADKVYARRDKHDRSVAAMFLLDMSASTDDKIKNPDGSPAEDGEPPRRIIDVEKEALVLMAEALEALGDAYAVYGFSGYGRDQVDAFRVKSFDEPYDRRIQGRVAAIEPQRSTRMGPVIRHAAARLGRQEARLKALILLSDGYPQDFDYGQDRKSKEYGLQDTAKAIAGGAAQGGSHVLHHRRSQRPRLPAADVPGPAIPGDRRHGGAAAGIAQGVSRPDRLRALRRAAGLQ